MPMARWMLRISKLPTEMQQDLLNRTVWQARRVGHRVYAELPLSLQTQQGYSLADFTTDLVKNNSSIEGLMLDTGSSLNCALAQEKWTAECQAAVQQIIDIKNQTKKAAKYYTNISNNYQTALKVDGNQTSFKGLKQVVQLFQIMPILSISALILFKLHRIFQTSNMQLRI